MAIALGLLAASAVAFVGLRPREPAYEGKKLSEWLKIFGNSTGGAYEEAEAAIQQIGTNALPTLLEMLRSKDSWLKVKLIGLVSKQSLVELELTSEDDRRSLAMFGFQVLGPRAKPILPALIELLNNAGTTDHAKDALDHLSVSFLGPEETLWLGTSITNENERVRDNVLSLLGREVVATALIPRLQDQDPGVRLSTIESFVRLSAIRFVNDPDGKYSVVVDALIKALQDTSPAVRADAALALGWSVVDAQRAVPFLVKHANDPDESVRQAVAAALSRLGPDPTAHADPEEAMKADLR
jgi:HEAT repeat protein